MLFIREKTAITDCLKLHTNTKKITKAMVPRTMAFPCNILEKYTFKEYNIWE